MSFLVFQFAALVLVPAITASARPAMTFFGAQLLAAALIAGEVVAAPEILIWLVSWPLIGAAAVLALLEALANQDSDLALILSDLSVERVSGVLSSATVALMMVMLGRPEAEAMALLPAEMEGLTGAETTLEALGASLAIAEGPGWTLGAVTAAVVVSYVLTGLRGRLLNLLREMKLSGVWAWVEMGGVIGALVVLPFLPLLVLFVLLLFVVLVGAIGKGLAIRAKARDLKCRVACGECGTMIRKEASICRECKAERRPR